MGLTKPALTDTADITVIDTDMDLIDAHDHSAGKGVQIGSGGIAAGAVGDTQLATGAVSSTKIANKAVTATQIADATITGTQLAAGAVNTSQLANNAVTGAKIANTTITDANLGNGTVMNAVAQKWRIESGSTASSAAGATTVSFSAPFTSAPIVWLTVQNAGSATPVLDAAPGVSSFQFSAYRTSDGTRQALTVYWLAIGQN